MTQGPAVKEPVSCPSLPSAHPEARPPLPAQPPSVAPFYAGKTRSVALKAQSVLWPVRWSLTVL